MKSRYLSMAGTTAEKGPRLRDGGLGGLLPSSPRPEDAQDGCYSLPDWPLPLECCTFSTRIGVPFPLSERASEFSFFPCSACAVLTGLYLPQNGACHLPLFWSGASPYNLLGDPSPLVLCSPTSREGSSTGQPNNRCHESQLVFKHWTKRNPSTNVHPQDWAPWRDTYAFMLQKHVNDSVDDGIPQVPVPYSYER